MADRFVRHTKMTAWGIGIVVEERGGQLTILWEDGNRRTFKAAHVAQLLVPATPESEEKHEMLVRGRASGGIRAPSVHLDLEAQLKNGFDDPQPFLVYADWLLQRGDPRGELIHAQHRKSAKLEKSILKEHADALVPQGLGKRGACTLVWNLGFIESARIGLVPDLDEMLVTFLAHPSSALLHELALDAAEYRGSPIEAIANNARQIKRLVLGARIAGNAWAMGDISGLLGLPRLVDLEVTGDRVFVSRSIASPKLQRLVVTSRRDDPATERAIVTFDAPALTTLAFDCLSGIDPPPPDSLARVPALRSLTLRHTTDTRLWLERILAAPCAKTLVDLDLASGDLDDEGAQFLAGARARLPALESLDLSQNRLGSASEAMLASFAPSVRATGLPPEQWRTRRERIIPPITDAARMIAQPRRWESLGVDVPRDRLWGRYPGSTGVYDVAAERGSTWTACSCPSNETPCKHALALHAMNEAGSMEEALPPYDHYERAGRKRYRTGFE